MRAIYLVLGVILMGMAIYHYKHGYVRGWGYMRQGKKITRADNQVVFWAILLGEIAGGAYLLIMAAY